MRKEEEEFVLFLKDKKNLRKASADIWEECNRYYGLVNRPCNTYSLAKHEVVEQILNEPAARKSFSVLAYYWVDAMGARYTADYWDDRDKASVYVCSRLRDLPEFISAYKRTCPDKYDERKSYPPCQDTSNGNAMTGKCFVDFLHPTLKQVYSGLVLTFLMRANRTLYEAANRHEIVKSNNVCFMMI